MMTYSEIKKLSKFDFNSKPKKEREEILKVLDHEYELVIERIQKLEKSIFGTKDSPASEINYVVAKLLELENEKIAIETKRSTFRQDESNGNSNNKKDPFLIAASIIGQGIIDIRPSLIKPLKVEDKATKQEDKSQLSKAN